MKLCRQRNRPALVSFHENVSLSQLTDKSQTCLIYDAAHLMRAKKWFTCLKIRCAHNRTLLFLCPLLHQACRAGPIAFPNVTAFLEKDNQRAQEFFF